jgi:probable FeS assembly SUF system protein SufT
LFRIEGKDADALDKIVAAGPRVPENPTDADLEKAVWDQLRTCYDPEIPADVVELGLVYGVDVTPHPEGGQRVTVRLTLTAPGCGMGGVLARDVESKIAALPGVREVIVELVFDPPWHQGLMSEAARLQLGLL